MRDLGRNPRVGKKALFSLRFFLRRRSRSEAERGEADSVALSRLEFGGRPVRGRTALCCFWERLALDLLWRGIFL